MLHSTDDYSGRVVGCLFGGAIGDALGYSIEFLSMSEILSDYGDKGIQEFELNYNKQAEVSDDTQMTLFTAEGIVESIGKNENSNQATILSEIQKQTLNWYRMLTTPDTIEDDAQGLMRFSVLKNIQAPGHTCMSNCANGAIGTPELRLNDSKGCGGVMRVAPIGLCPRLTTEEAFEIASRSAAQTHGHPTGYISSGVMAAIVRELLDGSDLERATNIGLDIARTWDDADETLNAVEKALQLVREDHTNYVESLPLLGEGWIAEEALAIGLYASFVGGNFCDTVRLACNHTGDSDSTASIAGQLYGAQHGMKDIPIEWMEKLDVLEPLLYITGRFNDAWGEAS